jgi:penicillin-binding protein activator
MNMRLHFGAPPLESGPMIKLTFSMISVLFFGLVFAGCGPKAFTKGEYDDPTRTALLDDKFNEADLQQMAETIVQAMVGCDSIVESRQKPVVAVEKVQNRTEEHIDTVSLTDKIRTALIKSRKVRFINKEERGTLEDEYQYNESGNVSSASQKKRGKQIGADYIMSGSLATNVQEVGNDKLIYYKLTMNLTNLETSTIDCTEEREIRKKFRKRSVGL